MHADFICELSVERTGRMTTSECTMVTAGKRGDWEKEKPLAASNFSHRKCIFMSRCQKRIKYHQGKVCASQSHDTRA